MQRRSRRSPRPTPRRGRHVHWYATVAPARSTRWKRHVRQPWRAAAEPLRLTRTPRAPTHWQMPPTPRCGRCPSLTGPCVTPSRTCRQCRTVRQRARTTSAGSGVPMKVTSIPTRTWMAAAPQRHGAARWVQVFTSTTLHERSRGRSVHHPLRLRVRLRGRRRIGARSPDHLGRPLRVRGKT